MTLKAMEHNLLFLKFPSSEHPGRSDNAVERRIFERIQRPELADLQEADQGPGIRDQAGDVRERRRRVLREDNRPQIGISGR
jgi:hypothetical protein